MRLDLSTPMPGLGVKGKEALLEKLSIEGFSRPCATGPSTSEIRLFESALDRIQRRVDRVFAELTKEIRAAKKRLRGG